LYSSLVDDKKVFLRKEYKGKTIFISTLSDHSHYNIYLYFTSLTHPGVTILDTWFIVCKLYHVIIYDIHCNGHVTPKNVRLLLVDFISKQTNKQKKNKKGKGKGQTKFVTAKLKKGSWKLHTCWWLGLMSSVKIDWLDVA
jgi:hypothetical protein